LRAMSKAAATPVVVAEFVIAVLFVSNLNILYPLSLYVIIIVYIYLEET